MNKDQMSKEKRYRYFETLLGENKAEFVAEDLKETYNELRQELQIIADGTYPEYYVPIFSYNRKEESDGIMDMMEAIELVYSLYCTESIRD